MDFNHAYLTEQIITYLGNKRKLLPAIHEVLANLLRDDSNLRSRLENGEAVSYDAFSGSGVVSRLFRASGFISHANDLESYAYPINSTFLEVSESEYSLLFKPIYEWLQVKFNRVDDATCYYDKVLNILNSISISNPYFSLYYAPADTNNPKFDSERLFYTHENALKLDTWSAIIHDPFFDNHALAKNILAASVLYVMGKQINTSGVMKGYHNGWGGRGGAALNRILAPMILQRIPNTDKQHGKAWTGDAMQTMTKIQDIDVIYADPPYNQHQYGANYHLLTTFWNNDQYNPGPVIKGSRAGIRVHHNRSLYAQAKEAAKAFDSFVKTAAKHTKYLIVSYNNEGLISTDSLLTMLSQSYSNHVDVVMLKHDKFKGGKSTQTSNAVVEYLFVVKMNTTQSKNDLKKVVEKTISVTNKTTYTDSYIDPILLKSLFTVDYTKNGWHITNPYGWYMNIKKDRKVLNISTQPISDKENELLKSAILNKESLLKIYITEQNWAKAIKLVSSFKLKRDISLFTTYTKLIFEGLQSSTDLKSLEKIKKLSFMILNKYPDQL